MYALPGDGEVRALAFPFALVVETATRAGPQESANAVRAMLDAYVVVSLLRLMTRTL